MSLLVNIRQLATKNLHLQGEMACEELDWDTRDELIQVTQPLQYDLQVQKLEKGILVQGYLRQLLDCQCVRCLNNYVHEVKNTQWNCLLELEGEEKVTIINDCVDLTPHMREDILLAFPQHPLCGSQCEGLAARHSDEPAGEWKSDAASSVWDQLDKLKL